MPDKLDAKKFLAEARRIKQEQEALNGKRENVLPKINKEVIRTAIARHFGVDEDLYVHLEAVNAEFAVAATIASEKEGFGKNYANGFLAGFAFALLVWDEYLRTQQAKTSETRH